MEEECAINLREPLQNGGARREFLTDLNERAYDPFDSAQGRLG